MGINFQEIVLEGHFRPYDRDLSGYFYREFRKSKFEGCKAPVFFINCLLIVGFLKRSYTAGIKKRAEFIEGYIDQYSDLEPEKIIAYEKELEELKSGHFMLDLTSFARGKYPYTISHYEISNIHKALIEGFKKASPDYDIWTEKPLKLDPIEYFQSRKAEIILCLTKRLDEEYAHTIYDDLMAVIHKLAPLRTLKSETCALLQEAIDDIYFEPELISYCLLHATTGNDTYCYAYNFLAEKANRKYIFPHDLKEIAEHDLLDMIAAENIQKIEDTDDLLSATTLKKTGSSIEKLTLPQIALKYAWEGKTISKQNSLEIAKSHGYESGSKLLQIYSKFMKKSDRVADPDRSVTIMKNKIKLGESVIEMLSPPYKANALEELNILRNIFEKVYLKKDV